MSDKTAAWLIIAALLFGGAESSKSDTTMSAGEAMSITKHEQATYNDQSSELPIRLMVYADRSPQGVPLVYVIPTCWGGVEHTDQQSIDHFKQYHTHLGGFRSRTLAHHYAEMLSELNDDDYRHLLYYPDKP